MSKKIKTEHKMHYSPSQDVLSSTSLCQSFSISNPMSIQQTPFLMDIPQNNQENKPFYEVWINDLGNISC